VGEIWIPWKDNPYPLVPQDSASLKEAEATMRWWSGWTLVASFIVAGILYAVWLPMTSFYRKTYFPPRVPNYGSHLHNHTRHVNPYVNHSSKYDKQRVAAIHAKAFSANQSTGRIRETDYTVEDLQANIARDDTWRAEGK
jgi:hypothetical protein